MDSSHQDGLKGGITHYSGQVNGMPTAFCSTEAALLFALKPPSWI